MKRKISLLACPMILLLGYTSGSMAGRGAIPIEVLGERIFEDQDLSINHNQSCASCHDAGWGGTGPDSIINGAGAVYEGSIPGRFGNRKPPSSAYATPSPVFHFSTRGDGQFVGGNFWDGRATGERLANPAADQAQGPFLNPAEQALPDAACVVYRVSMASYAPLYEKVWGAGISSIAFPADTDSLCGQEDVTIQLTAEDRAKVEMEYDNIALSIAAYEDSPEVNRFDSKFDAGRHGKLSEQERRGFELFQGKGKCAACHVSSGRNAAFTDFTYDNLGVPQNPENPALIADPTFVDSGLGGFLMKRGEPASVYEPEIGKMKVPTLRNVDKRPTPDAVKAYMHNGYFKTLKGVVHFYNTRDVKDRCPGPFTEAEALAANCWPAPEVAENVNAEELGNLGLTDEEEDAIVAFMKALTDDEHEDDKDCGHRKKGRRHSECDD
ncbi:MAG: c-type cytochrome [Candidatus Thiodiazotropha sp. (ex Epidulcina cf. delphinae)]|nr:c-type cytochrome [Candidatus Thiodiazotropha sp. (ex Epidulcina cf. delphinae)]